MSRQQTPLVKSTNPIGQANKRDAQPIGQVSKGDVQ